MKKRLSLIFIFLIVSSALIFTSFIVNNKKIAENKNEIKTTENTVSTQVKETVAQVNSAAAKPISEVKTPEKTETKTTVKTAVKPAAAAKPISPAANVKFINTINNKTIASIYIDFAGKTAYDATLDSLHQLGQDPRPTQIDRFGGYFKSMLGLTEKVDGGPNSGWLFYVNGKKADVGSKSYKLKSTDKLVWKFVEDYTKY